MDKSTFMFFGTPIETFSQNYPQHPLGKPLPFKDGKIIATQLPKNIAAVRAAVAVAFGCLGGLALSSTFLCWPVVVVGIAFAGWTIYSHLLSEDPLIKAFHTIAGSKENFAKLPENKLMLTANTKTDQAIKSISWETLPHRISKTTLLDGRRVIIVKGQSRLPLGQSNRYIKTIFAFVEKTCFKDVNKPDFMSKAMGYLHAIFRPFQSNTIQAYNSTTAFISQTDSNTTYRWTICSSIPGYMANEFAVQLGTA